MALAVEKLVSWAATQTPQPPKIIGFIETKQAQNGTFSKKYQSVPGFPLTYLY